MKQCGICGHAAERGSICYDCRSALKRARDATISQFQSLPALAVVTAGGGVMPRSVGRAPAARIARPARSARKPVNEASPPAATALVEVPGTRRGGAFVWVIVTLMVFVVTYVAYGVITTAIETASNQQAQFAKPETPAQEPAAIVPRAAGADSAVLTPHEPDLHAAPVLAQHGSPPPASSAHAAHAPVTTPAPRTASRAKDPLPRSAPTDTSSARVTPPATAAPPPEVAQQNVAAPTPARAPRPAEAPRVDRWERMAAAIQSCAGSNFLGGMLCEQKVRFEYCDGWWGRVPQCPGGGIPNDHGQ